MSEGLEIKLGAICRSCGQRNDRGVVRCAGCGKSLRPLGLGVICLLGVLGGVWACAGVFHFTWIGEQMISLGGSLLLILLGVAQATFFLELGHGRLWAWIAALVMTGLNLIGDVVGMSIAGNTADPTMLITISVVHFVLMISLLAYLLTPRVREFCGSLTRRADSP